MRKQKTREDKLLSNSHTASRMIVEETLPWADQTNSFYLLDQWLANCSSLTKSSLNVKWKWKSPGSVQSLSRVWLFATSWITARQASPSITAFQISLKLTSIESVMPSSHLILCHPFLLLPPIPPSIRVFSNESTLLMRWPKDWSFSFSIIPSKEHPGLIAVRIDWLDLLAVQGTLEHLVQHHSSKALILQRSASSQSNSRIHTWLLGKK